ncbi:ubiquitin fusion degradation protein 1 homolog isoform X1 [Tanacetum coccineum]
MGSNYFRTPQIRKLENKIINAPSALMPRPYKFCSFAHTVSLYPDDEKSSFRRGRLLLVKKVNLPKGTYVKLATTYIGLFEYTNPKANVKFEEAGPMVLNYSLETTLRNFSCLTTGDSIMVAYNNKQYYIDIIESKPKNAITIIETDCEVDFAPPLDYKEPEKPSKAPIQEQEVPPEEPKFNPFTGSGRRLDGKPLKYQPPPVSSPADFKQKQPAVPSAGTSSQSGSRQTQGKLVFGTNANRTAAAPQKQKEVAKEAKQEEPAKEEPKFQAFSGKKYSLKG